MSKENVPCMSKPYQTSKPTEVPSANAVSAKLSEVSSNTNSDIKLSTSKENAGVENATDAKKEAQKQDDR